MSDEYTKNMPLFERAILKVSPKWAASRARNRNTVYIQAAYEGAAKTLRTRDWRADGKSINAELDSALHTLRNRSRDLIRNTGNGTKAVTAVQNSVVGTGFKPSCNKPELDELLQEFARSTSVDIDEKMNLYGLQSLMMRTIFESGECIVERVRLGSEDYIKGNVPLAIRVLEPDYLADNEHFSNEHEDIVQGISFNKKGRRIGYNLYDTHPGDNTFYSSQNITFIPAEDIIHAYRVDRPGQLRGVPWLSPVMLKMKDFADYEDAHIRRQQIAACFSTFITQNGVDTPVQIGEYDPYELHGHGIEPGRITVLHPGEEVTFGNPPGVDGYADFSSITLRQIAAGLGITYESLTGDYSKSNFSASKMAFIDQGRNVLSWRDHIFFSQIHEKIGRWFLEAAAAAGYNTTGAVISWAAPPVELIDKMEALEAAEKIMLSGLGSPLNQIRKLGEDPEDVIADTVKWNEMKDKHGLKFHSDSRFNAQVGAAVIEDPKPEDTEDE